jgi:hypothetical protein
MIKLDEICLKYVSLMKKFNITLTDSELDSDSDSDIEMKKSKIERDPPSPPESDSDSESDGEVVEINHYELPTLYVTDADDVERYYKLWVDGSTLRWQYGVIDTENPVSGERDFFAKGKKGSKARTNPEQQARLQLETKDEKRVRVVQKNYECERRGRWYKPWNQYSYGVIEKENTKKIQ